MGILHFDAEGGWNQCCVSLRLPFLLKCSVAHSLIYFWILISFELPSVTAHTDQDNALYGIPQLETAGWGCSPVSMRQEIRGGREETHSFFREHPVNANSQSVSFPRDIPELTKLLLRMNLSHPGLPSPTWLIWWSGPITWHHCVRDASRIWRNRDYQQSPKPMRRLPLGEAC